jgi:sulfate permease, SulP family
MANNPEKKQQAQEQYEKRYASLVALAVYAHFGTSNHLIIGAEAPMAILVATSIATLAAGGDPARFAALALMKAFLVGCRAALFFNAAYFLLPFCLLPPLL